LVLLGVLAGPAGAGELARPDWRHPPELTLPSIESPPPLARPELRSYRPYSGLQFGFRPEPPGKRGIRPEEETRPEVVMPEPVAPLIEYGTPSPYASRHYSYCAELATCR
jgi:hypothetical protein